MNPEAESGSQVMAAREVKAKNYPAAMVKEALRNAARLIVLRTQASRNNNLPSVSGFYPHIVSEGNHAEQTRKAFYVLHRFRGDSTRHDGRPLKPRRLANLLYKPP